jgi:hypothetical protein
MQKVWLYDQKNIDIPTLKTYLNTPPNTISLPPWASGWGKLFFIKCHALSLCLLLISCKKPTSENGVFKIAEMSEYQNVSKVHGDLQILFLVVFPATHINCKICKDFLQNKIFTILMFCFWSISAF